MADHLFPSQWLLMTKSKMTIADLRSKFHLPLFRRSSSTSVHSATTSSLHSVVGESYKSRSKTSLLQKQKPNTPLTEPLHEEVTALESENPPLPSPLFTTTNTVSTTTVASRSTDPLPTPEPSPFSGPELKGNSSPQLFVEEPTPDLTPLPASESRDTIRPTASQRQQSLAKNSEKPFLQQLLDDDDSKQPTTTSQDYFGAAPTLSAKMLHRKIWVKRAGQAATLVTINEDDLVDDVKDMILKKYANSLGRSFDSPDVTLRIVPREQSLGRRGPGERTLGPEESMARTLDAYYPGGQTVNDALLIDVPQRRTPRQSPRYGLSYHHAPHEEMRPAETGGDYFPVMPVAMNNNSPHMPSNISAAGSTNSAQAHHAISILNTGHAPPLPSPGGSRGTRLGHRPKFGRNNTSSPTAVQTTVPHHGEARPRLRMITER